MSSLCFWLFWNLPLTDSILTSYDDIVLSMRARATISFISRNLDLTVLRANGKKMGCALFFALDCREAHMKMEFEVKTQVNLGGQALTHVLLSTSSSIFCRMLKQCNRNYMSTYMSIQICCRQLRRISKCRYFYHVYCNRLFSQWIIILNWPCFQRLVSRMQRNNTLNIKFVCSSQ